MKLIIFWKEFEKISVFGEKGKHDVKVDLSDFPDSIDDPKLTKFLNDFKLDGYDLLFVNGNSLLYYPFGFARNHFIEAEKTKERMERYKNVIATK